MKKIFRILGLALVVAAILAISIAGAVSAAGGGDNAKGTQNQGELCLCGEGTCGDCVCTDCTPNDYSHNYEYLTPGPHGPHSK